MPKKLTSPALCVFIAAALAAFPVQSLAKTSQWTLAKGEVIEAEAVEALGPVALFDNGAMVPFSMLTSEDCLRFYQAVSKRAPRADDWSRAKSPVSEEVQGRLMKYDGDRLVPDDLKGRPEPELYMFFFTTNSVSQAWDMVGKTTPELFSKLQAAFPGEVQGVLFGVQESPAEHASLAITMKGGWLVTDYRQQVEMDTIRRWTPQINYGLVVATRSGVAIFGPDAMNENQIRQTFAKTAALLDQIRPSNHHGWASRAHYLSAVQTVLYANGKSDPVPMGNPLVAEGLRQRKIYTVDAKIHVAADGSIPAVDIVPESLPPGMAAPLADALRKSSVFVPAVDHGKFVDGVYAYHMDVPH